MAKRAPKKKTPTRYPYRKKIEELEQQISFLNAQISSLQQQVAGMKFPQPTWPLFPPTQPWQVVGPQEPTPSHWEITCLPQNDGCVSKFENRMNFGGFSSKGAA